jgi:hypothetical protein
MPTHHDGSTGKSSPTDDHCDLLFQRMAMLGLDLEVIERRHSETIAEIKRQCANCEFEGACAIDLERDPNNPVWEAYCPNTAALNALTASLWPTP